MAPRGQRERDQELLLRAAREASGTAGACRAPRSSSSSEAPRATDATAASSRAPRDGAHDTRRRGPRAAARSAARRPARARARRARESGQRPVEPHAAVVGEQAHQDPVQRGLARAVRSDQRDTAARRQLEAHAVERRHAPVALADAAPPQSARGPSHATRVMRGSGSDSTQAGREERHDAPDRLDEREGRRAAKERQRRGLGRPRSEARLRSS